MFVFIVFVNVPTYFHFLCILSIAPRDIFLCRAAMQFWRSPQDEMYWGGTAHHPEGANPEVTRRKVLTLKLQGESDKSQDWVRHWWAGSLMGSMEADGYFDSQTDQCCLYGPFFNVCLWVFFIGQWIHFQCFYFIASELLFSMVAPWWSNVKWIYSLMEEDWKSIGR